MKAGKVAFNFEQRCCPAMIKKIEEGRGQVGGGREKKRGLLRPSPPSLLYPIPRHRVKWSSAICHSGRGSMDDVFLKGRTNPSVVSATGPLPTNLPTINLPEVLQIASPLSSEGYSVPVALAEIEQSIRARMPYIVIFSGTHWNTQAGHSSLRFSLLSLSLHLL